MADLTNRPDPAVASAMQAHLVEELADEAARLVRGHLAGLGLQQLWSETDRIRFRLRDGRTGDVEVFVNWDVVTADDDARSCAPGPSPTRCRECDHHSGLLRSTVARMRRDPDRGRRDSAGHAGTDECRLRS